MQCILTFHQAGLQTDLGITDIQYQTAITVTYVPYIAAELPSNLLLKKIGPRLLLPFLCTTWGVITTLQSQVHNYAGLLACRFFLGLAEGGLFPGIVLYLSGFYRPHELQVRISLFFSASALSGAFSGLLAAAIQQMEGLGGMRGWSWIFLLEGLFTVCFGIFAFFVLPNSPEQVRTFKPHHIAHCKARLQIDNKFPDDGKITARGVLSAFTSIHVLLLCTVLFASGVLVFGLAYFTPSIVQSLGYSKTRTQLMTVPPFACAFIVTMLSAYLADRYKARGASAIASNILALVGAAMTITARSFGMRYTALIFLITGTYAAAPSLISWLPNNTAPHVRRATGIAMGFVSTNAGGILSTWLYPRKEAPYYRRGASVNLGMVCWQIVAAGVLVWYLVGRNGEKESQPERVVKRAGVEGKGIEEEYKVLGDRHPGFRYTY